MEAQLDQCRQEIEKSVKHLRDYEAKVNIMERYIHTMKIDPNGKKDTGKKKKLVVKASVHKERELESSGSKRLSKTNSEDYSSTSNLRKFEKQFEVKSCFCLFNLKLLYSLILHFSI